MWGLHWRPKVDHADAFTKLNACLLLLDDASVHRLTTCTPSAGLKVLVVLQLSEVSPI